MEIFRIGTMPDDYQAVWYKNNDKRMFDLIGEGNPIGDRWQTPLLRLGGECENPEVTPDFPGLMDHMLVVRDRAWQALRPIIDSSVEALPAIHPSGESYWVLNVIRILDCLLVDLCKTNRPPDDPDPYFSSIYTYAFDEKLISGEHIFRCPQMKRLEIYVSSTFKGIVEENGFIGLRFIPIFSSEEEAS